MILEEEGLYVPTLGRRVKGIVPLEMALCLKVFIQSKYFTLEELNRSIKEFPYKWSDKADAPQLVPVNFAARKSVGGNGHENWTLLRLLPLMVGSKIPEDLMSDPAHLRVVLADHDVRKLLLPFGIPVTVDELHSIICDTFGITGNFTLHYKDAEFGSEYFSLYSTTDIKDKDTIKVVYILDPPTVTLSLTDVTDNYASIQDQSCEDQSCEDQSCVSSVSSSDTLPVSSFENSPGQRSQRWPTEFIIPRFSASTEIKLQVANENLAKNGTFLSGKDLIQVLPDILGKLSEAIYEYSAYPSSLQFSQVAEALIQKHPCLKEPGSFNGCYGWTQRLKYKMNNFRSKLRFLGCPELDVNSLKRKPAHEQTPAKNVKKPRKAEVNYLPPHTQGETSTSLETERVELLSDVMKTGNNKVIAEKMVKTFSLRRQEIINEAPAVSHFMKRWPALFNVKQINEEFKRLTTVSLESTFLAKLDKCTQKLLSLAQSKGGAAGLKIRHIMDKLLVV
ncbi:hypothetical protein MHYP_G00192320 [Metynnis hypsauchen]